MRREREKKKKNWEIDETRNGSLEAIMDEREGR